MLFYRKILLILPFISIFRMDDFVVVVGWLAACSCHFCPVCIASSEKILHQQNAEFSFDVISLIIIIRLVIIFLNCCTIIQRYCCFRSFFFFVFTSHFQLPASCHQMNESRSKHTKSNVTFSFKDLIT